MPDVLAALYVMAICFSSGVSLFAVVETLEPNRRFALVKVRNPCSWQSQTKCCFEAPGNELHSTPTIGP